MITFPSRQRARFLLTTVSVLSVLSACTEGFDYDLRGTGGGFSTSATAGQAATSQRPQPDNRGIISYPNYQVAVAERGDTIESVASRIGLDAATLGSFNGIEQGVPLRQGEIIALPTRVAEPSPATGAVGTGPIQPGGVDIGRLAGDAIERSPQSSGDGVRVAALPPAATNTPKPQSGQEPVRHKVTRGETAYTISRLYNVPVTSLAEWNGLGSDFAIREGQYLLIPVAKQAPPSPATRPVSKPGDGSQTPVPPSAAKPLPPAQEPIAEPAEPEPEIDVGEQTDSSDVARMLFPPTFSILNFTPKLVVASMYAMTLLAFVPTRLTLLNSQPSG